MYLKSIEVHGFKAFANKIIFSFDKGITGIVGPNGSGKSNVADAVRWVLGEQSPKQLRGSSMQDVIFSGTETRKPLGFAYVALTLDNSDHWLPIEFEEVTVARRVYRSGESEYLINGAACRLRDVQELFFDTGVGKEGYSIIGQGQIDKILSGKPEERREIFDEAAGITKYKKRKTIAERDLEVERANLARISDIVAEIEKQLGPLEKQDEKARIYLKMKEELKNLEVNQFLLEYERSASVKKELEDKYLIAAEDLGHTKEEYEKAKEDYDRLLDELEQHQATLQDAKEQRTEKMLRLEKATGEINVLTEQITAVTERDTNNANRLESLDAQIREKQELLEELKHQQTEYQEQLSRLGEEQKKAEALLGEMKASINSMLQEEKDCNELHIRCLNENTTLKTELERYSTILEQQNITKAELNAKLLRYKTDADNAESAVNEANAGLKACAEKVQKAMQVSETIEKQVTELTDSIRSKSDAFSKAQQSYIESHSKAEALTNLVERYDGYGNSIRRVMEQKKAFPGITGVVADIIEVKPEYETAIETALGGNIQNVVVDTTETAKGLIEFLKQNHLGRATFLPLSGIRAKKDEYAAEIFTKQGVIGVAASLVSVEEVYQEAVRYLLGRFLVVDTIDHAIKLERQYQQSLRIVTLEGELFQPGGAVSGGAFRNQSNLLGRRREVDSLKEKVLSEKTVMEKLSEELAELRSERDVLRKTSEEKKQELQGLYVELNTAKLNLNHINEQSKELLGNRDSLRQELANVEQMCREAKANAEQVNAKIAANRMLSEEQKEKADSITNELQKTRNAEDNASADAVRVLTEYSGLEQSLAYRKENLHRLQTELTSLQNERATTNSSRASHQTEIDDKFEQIAAFEAEKKLLNEELRALEEQIEQTACLADEITKQNKTFFETREHLANRMANLDKEVYRLQSQKEKMEEQLESQTHYMWEEYEITYSVATNLRDETITNPALTRKQAYELKQKIRSLGDVNVNAIEDYKNTKERFEFLSGQKTDIQDAEKQLVGIIDELEVQMRKQFTDTFAEVSKRFDKVFRELFGGGKGTLELMENEDVLEAGILIIAQPPGKKLQNMMQLSGGEKALTAISLLFAILDLKPSPFCLLDEIEAALDDSNVSRFANYLHKLTKETQFIVITHRRGTMAAADALYGITMQEKGVSTLVSVNLIENELEK